MKEDGACVGAEEMSVLMDLLSHDMLNKNQATLSYLELIHSMPRDERKTRDFSEKAASQVRTSSMLLDGIRRFVSSARRGVMPTATVAVADVMESVAKDISDIFPYRSIDVDLSGVAPEAMAVGGQCVHDLFMNLLANVVQLGPEQECRVVVSARSGRSDRPGLTTVEVSAPTAVMPQGVDDSLISRAAAADLSKMTRVSGIVFAGSIARALGGTFSARVIEPASGTGCVFEVSFEEGRPQ